MKHDELDKINPVSLEIDDKKKETTQDLIELKSDRKLDPSSISKDKYQKGIRNSLGLSQYESIGKLFRNTHIENQLKFQKIIDSLGFSQYKNIGKLFRNNHIENQLKFQKTIDSLGLSQYESIGKLFRNNHIENQLKFQKTIDSLGLSQYKNIGKLFHNNNIENQLKFQKTIDSLGFSQYGSVGKIFKNSLAVRLQIESLLKKSNNYIDINDFYEEIINSSKGKAEDQKIEINTNYENNQEYISLEKRASPLLVFVIALFLSINNATPNIVKKVASGVVWDIAIALAFEYLVKPYADNLMEDKSDNEPTTNKKDFSETENLCTFLLDKRVTTHPIDFLELPNRKSEIIESLPPQTLITVIHDKTIPKSWLKVKITLDQSEVEGYVLRRYTSPIK